jgi:hypothetical protein
MDVAVVEFLKLVIPAGLVLYAMYLTVKTFLSKDMERKLVEMRMKNTELVLPVRLQAYERMCLFLERISPNNLILRLNDPSFTARHFQQVLLSEIREEFNHNLSQQVYMSDKSWSLVKKSMEDVNVLINQAAQGLAPEAKGIDLAKAVFEKIILNESDPTEEALRFVKNEIRQVF